MDSEIQNPVSRGDWTLFVRSKVPADCMKWAQCDLLDQVDWEEMGIYQSKQFDIDFPYYRNKEKKIIVVKGKMSILLRHRKTKFLSNRKWTRMISVESLARKY